MVKTEYSVVGVQAELRVILLDFAGNRFYSTVFRPAPTNDGTSPTASGFFHGEMFVLPVNGAKQCNIRIIGQTGVSGNVERVGMCDLTAETNESQSGRAAREESRIVQSCAMRDSSPEIPSE